MRHSVHTCKSFVRWLIQMISRASLCLILDFVTGLDCMLYIIVCIYLLQYIIVLLYFLNFVTYTMLYYGLSVCHKSVNILSWLPAKRLAALCWMRIQVTERKHSNFVLEIYPKLSTFKNFAMVC